MKKHKGFTLSEILLALSIVGVLACMMVPMIISNVQQNQFNFGVNQAYTMLSQAILQIQYQNGGIVNVTSGTSLASDLCNAMQCVQTGTSASLYSPISNPFYYSTYKGSSFLSNIATDANPGVILSNGMYLFDIHTYASCVGTYGINACGNIGVDINGPYQGPNMNGEDVYSFFVVLNNGVYSILPSGTANDTVSGPGQTYSCKIGNWASGCTYQRLFYPNTMP